MEPLWIIKLGGSLAEAGALDRWLSVVAESPAKLVIVPGGGPFADAVRAAQAPLGYSDRAAHHMALLAMEQFGVVIAERLPEARLARDPAAVGQALRRGERPIWLGTEMALGDPMITPGWAVTSDSVAAWLAGRLGARALALVKSVTAAGRDLATLIADGVIDSAFQKHFPARTTRLLIVGPGEESILGQALAAA